MAGALCFLDGCKNNGNSIVFYHTQIHTFIEGNNENNIQNIQLNALHNKLKMLLRIHQFTALIWCCAGPAFYVNGLYLYRSWVTFVPRLIHRLLKWCKTHMYISNLTAKHTSIQQQFESFFFFTISIAGAYNTHTHFFGCCLRRVL